MIQQIHLKGKWHSKRVVQVRMLDAFEVEDNLTQAAKLLGKSAEFFEIKKTEWRNGVKRFLVSVSEPVDNPADATMRKVNIADLDATFTELFTSKDQQVLEAMYRDFHEVSAEEVDAIVGKAIPVASEG